MDREKVIKAYEDFVNGYECFCTSDDYEYEMHKAVLALLKEQEAAYQGAVELLQQKTILFDDAIKRLKEQEELLKHEYWRGYKNGRADERGLQEGTIMQTFSPD